MSELINCWNALPTLSRACDGCLRGLARLAVSHYGVPGQDGLEIVQDAMTKLWRAARAGTLPRLVLEEPNSEARAERYLHRVVRNLVFDRSRRSKRVKVGPEEDVRVSEEADSNLLLDGKDDIGEDSSVEAALSELRDFVHALSPAWVEAFDARLGLLLGTVTWPELLQRAGRAAWDQRFKRLKERGGDAIARDPDARRRERLGMLHTRLFRVKSDSDLAERLSGMNPPSTTLVRPPPTTGLGYAVEVAPPTLSDLALSRTDLVFDPLLARAGLQARAHPNRALSIGFGEITPVRLSGPGHGAFLVPAENGTHHVWLRPQGLSGPIVVHVGEGRLQIEPDGDTYRVSLSANPVAPLPDRPFELLADALAERIPWLADAIDAALRFDGPELGPLLAAALADAYDDSRFDEPEPIPDGPGAAWLRERTTSTQHALERRVRLTAMLWMESILACPTAELERHTTRWRERRDALEAAMSLFASVGKTDLGELLEDLDAEVRPLLAHLPFDRTDHLNAAAVRHFERWWVPSDAPANP